jgi:hypothetical protein
MLAPVCVGEIIELRHENQTLYIVSFDHSVLEFKFTLK